jgi:hypothetical protein
MGLICSISVPDCWYDIYTVKSVLTRLCRQMFLWAATIFTSRSFTSNIMTASQAEPFALLYPVLDSFNHRFGAKVVWNIEKGDFALGLTESVKKGDEVYNNYAPKGNQECKHNVIEQNRVLHANTWITVLMGYGFCIPSNPCDEVAIRLGRPPPAVHTTLRSKFPKRFSTPEWDPEAATFFLRGTKHYSGGYPPPMHEVKLRCLRGLPPDLYGTIHTILTHAFQIQHEGEVISDEELVEASLHAILERLVAKRESIVQWDEMLVGGPKNVKQRFAKIYRDGQLEILEEIIEELKSHLEAE